MRLSEGAWVFIVIFLKGFLMNNEPMNHKTIRLLMPQWQGGDMGVSYPLGARLLAWLAPESDAPLLEVPVTQYDGSSLQMEDGIKGRKQIIRQLRAARNILDAYEPDRVITFGGDCLVSQAPFAYLNEKYNGELGVLWIDAHLDVMTPQDFPNAHAMVLGNLLGEGDAGLAREVKVRLNPKNVMYAGVDEIRDIEVEPISRLGMHRTGSAELADNSAPVMSWIRESGIRHLAVHLDLDVLDPKLFRSLLFNNPNGDQIDAPAGKMTLEQLTRLIVDVSSISNVVGMTFAEHMPWDDINLMNMMAKLPFMK